MKNIKEVKFLFDLNKIKFGVIPSPEDKRDYPITKLTSKLKTFPEEFCLEDVPTQNQYDIGECVAEGLGYSSEVVEKVQSGKYKKFSRGFTYANREPSDYQGSGMMVREALKNKLKYGAVLYEDFPYEAEVPEIYKKLEPVKEELLEKAYKYRISAYAALRTDDDIKTALIKLRTPVVGSWYIYESFSRITPQNPIMPVFDKFAEKFYGYHCMIILGWKLINGKEHWIVKNSWGNEFGDNGKCYAPFEINQVELWSTTDNIYPLKDYKITRIAGQDRIDTAIKISQYAQNTSESIALCNAYNFPDALTASSLNIPILLTETNVLDNRTLEEIKRLNVKNIYIIGGVGAISEEIENYLKNEYFVTRICGKDRYQTSYSIAEYIMGITETDTIILVTGEDFPDALSIAPYAAKYNYPIVFAKQDINYKSNPETMQKIKEWGIKNVLIVGGYGAVSVSISSDLKYKEKLNVVRLSGDNRYLTSLMVASYFYDNKPYSGITIATGLNFPDALSGSIFASKFNYPILLVGENEIEEDIAGYVSRLSGIKDVFVLGGDGVVSQKVINDLLENK